MLLDDTFGEAMLYNLSLEPAVSLRMEQRAPLSAGDVGRADTLS